jgi:nucleotide-binding universal stress UspA family protein
MSNQSRTFVVGVDASEDADRALQWTRDAAGDDDTIIALHAWDLPSMVGLDTYAVVPATDFEDLATRGIAELVERQDDARIVGVARQGRAGRALVEEGSERDADVLVVGHQGSGRASVVLGSTANYVVHHTERPIVVVRGESRAQPELVVVGVDDNELDEGENESVRALRWAYGIASARIIEVVHSWFVPSFIAGRFSNPGADFEELDAEAMQVAERIIAAAGDPPSGVDVRSAAINGTPEFALIEASRDADLVVVGSRGRGGFAGLILGSTTLDLASHAHCPVAIVR